MPGDRYSDFVFVPAELAEEVDLPLEVRKEILYLHAQLGTFDHWRLLGVPWGAPVEAVRQAHRERVKVLHPDRYAGRALGSYLGRMQQVFRAVTEARDVLCDPPRREAYLRQTAPPEEFARLEARRLEDEARSRERRARLARANPLVARASRTQELLERGKRALAEGRFGQAANDFLTVVGLDPRHPEARALAAEAKKRAAAERARELHEQGLAAEAVGNHAAALNLLRDAVEADPSQAGCAVAAARVAVEAGALDEARAFADAAVRAAPRDARAHQALGEVMHARGEPKEARKALERALELDPTLEPARALARKLRWSLFG